MRASDFYRDTARLQATREARRKAEEQANPKPKPPSELETLRARVAELEAANDRMREVIASQPLNSPTRLEEVAKILATVELK